MHGIKRKLALTCIRIGICSYPWRGDWDRNDLGMDGRLHNSYTGPEDPELIGQRQVGCYACITHVDHQIGRSLQALQLRAVFPA
jgi:hypothetical protein